MDTPKKSSYKNSERFLLKANKRKAALRLDRIFFLKHLDIKNLTPFIRKTCTCAKFCKLKTNVKIIVFFIQNLIRPTNIRLWFNHLNSEVWRSGWHTWIQQLKSFILRPHLRLYFQNSATITLADSTRIWTEMNAR